MSKALGSKRTIIALLIIVVVLIAGVAVWLWSFPSRPVSTGEKIEIVECTGNDQLTSAVVAVHNGGSGVVEITAIYIGTDLYSYSASVAPGKFAAASNQIAPGQTVAFNVTIASGSWPPQYAYAAKAVTKNGTEASSSTAC
jgi:hypothetical protein